MEIGFVGLGKMGQAMAGHLSSRGHRVVAYDASPSAVASVAARGVEAAASLKHLAEALARPRTVWVMVPAGRPVDEVIFDGLLPHLAADDLLVDGGNSHYKDSMRRAEQLREQGIEFLDVGTSGGVGGVATGLSLMAGGREKSFRRLEPLLEELAAPGGYGLMGPAGAGHFVKMVHNGIEYALLQSYAEGFELLREGPFELELGHVARVWNNGGVVRSWLLELVQGVLEGGGLEDVAAEVGGGQTGRWTVEAALESGVPFSMVGLALSERYRGRRESFAARLVAALRREFGGHPVKEKK
ncbi:MAG: decarboxylating 6-phosphogluconate dehydrogenase [Dehalococcoidales bacterium]